MTTDQIAQYYANLLILQFLSKPKAYATLKANALPIIMDQLPIQIQNAFNLDETLGPVAVGTQLDVIGKYAGVSRIGNTFNGPVSLSDSDFIILIQIALIQNTYAADLATIQALLKQFFAGEILVFDHSNMHMDYFISSTIGSDTLAQFFVKQKRLPKPMGVQLGTLVYAPVINNFFGFRTTKVPKYFNHGFNLTTAYDMDCPFLSTKDGI